MNNIEKISNVLKVLGDVNRFKIVLMLKKRKMCVCEIVEMLPLAFSTISAHLRLLLSSDILQREKEGKWVIYKLGEDPLISELMDFLLDKIPDVEKMELYNRLKEINRDICSLKLKEKRSRK